jgi:hypothetical protein
MVFVYDALLVAIGAGCVRVLDCVSISSELLSHVVRWQEETWGRTTADPAWLELRCTYELSDGQEMVLAAPPSSEVGVGDVIDVVAAPVIGIRMSDDFVQPPTQLAAARELRQAEDCWLVES